MEWDGVAAGLAFLNAGTIIAVGYIYKALRRGQTLPKSRSLADVLKSINTRLEESREHEDVQKLREKISKIKKMVNEGTEASIIVEVMASFLEDRLSLTLLLLEEYKVLRTEVDELHTKIDELKKSSQEAIQAMRTDYDNKVTKIDELKTPHQEEIQAMRTCYDNKFAAIQTYYENDTIFAVIQSEMDRERQLFESGQNQDDNEFAALQSKIDREQQLLESGQNQDDNGLAEIDRLQQQIDSWQNEDDTVQMAEFNCHLHSLLASRLGLDEKSFTIDFTMEQEKGAYQMRPWKVWNAPMHKKVNKELNELSKLAGDPEMKAWSEGSWDSSFELRCKRQDMSFDYKIRHMSGKELRTEAAKVLATLDSKEGAKRYKGIARYHPMLKRGLRILKHLA